MVLPVEQFSVGPSWLKEALGQYSEIGKARLSQLLSNKQSMENKRYPAIQDMIDKINQLKANTLNAQTQYIQSQIPQMNIKTQLLKYQLAHPELNAKTPLGMALSLFHNPSQQSTSAAPSMNNAALMNNQGSNNISSSATPDVSQETKNIALNNQPENFTEPDNFKKTIASMFLNNGQIPINDNMSTQQKLILSYLNKKNAENAQKQRLSDLQEKKDILSIQQAKQNLFSTPTQRELVANLDIAKNVFNNNLLPSAYSFLRNRSSMHPIDSYNSYKNIKQSMIQIISNMLKGSSGSRAASLVKLEDKINSLYPFSPDSTWTSSINKIGDILNSEGEIRSKSSSEQAKISNIPVNTFRMTPINNIRKIGSKTYVKMNGKWYEK